MATKPTHCPTCGRSMFNPSTPTTTPIPNLMELPKRFYLPGTTQAVEVVELDQTDETTMVIVVRPLPT